VIHCKARDNVATMMAAVIGFIIVIGVLFVGLVLVVHGTAVKNRWGVNLEAIRCPRCNAPQPTVRRPRSLRETLWGGGACRDCACEIDKWGREIR
jgi:hypothetical protein